MVFLRHRGDDDDRRIDRAARAALVAAKISIGSQSEFLGSTCWNPPISWLLRGIALAHDDEMRPIMVPCVAAFMSPSGTAFMISKKSALVVLALGLSVTAQAQEKKSDIKVAGNIASQPARDVGIAKISIPPVLAAAARAPYATLTSCGQINSAIVSLTKSLGPDLDSGSSSPRAGIAEVGGRAVVNSLIPFRGVVREVSGAASAQRRLDTAISAGYARRGFLRGLKIARHC
jgi:hypothetical protein